MTPVIKALISALINVRDGLALIAFLSLVVLVAFRTRRVPELLFGLLRDKLTRAQFSAFLHRLMTYGLAAFIALVVLAIVGQVLNRMTQPTALTLDQLRGELSKSEASLDARLNAESQFKLALDRINQHDLESAIASLHESIKAVPSLTAQEMLTYLYREKGDFANEASAWESAVKMARERGDSMALARLDRVSVPGGVLGGEAEHDLIGDSTPLPKGGNDYRSAVQLAPGLYICAGNADEGCRNWYYKVYLNAGRELAIGLRSPAPPQCCLAGVDILGPNGQTLHRQVGDDPRIMRGNAGPANTIYRTQWVAMEGGWHYLMTTADSGTVYRISIR
jgi:hypothetical protein